VHSNKDIVVMRHRCRGGCAVPMSLARQPRWVQIV